MQQFRDVVSTPLGRPIPGATVTVTLAGGGTPTLYSDDGVTALGSNVLTTDDNGEYKFYADNGRYTLTIVASGYSDTERDVVLWDQSDDRANVKDYPFMAVGDGVANDTTALGLGSAQPVGAIVPVGTYSATALDNGSGVGIQLQGVGEASVIVKEAVGTAGPLYLATGRTKLLLENLSVELVPDTGATNGVNIFPWNHDDIEIRRVTADGAVEIDAGTGARNYLGNITTVATGTRAGLKIIESDFTRFFYGFLKSNTMVSNESDITVALSSFDEMGSTYLLLNSPAVGASIENVLIIGNKLGSVLSQQPFGSSVGFPHRGSFAGNVSYCRLIANHATGYGGELFRAEENVKAMVWLGNTAKLDGKDGIEIIPNNVSGTVYTPTLNVLGDNVLINEGLVSAPALGWGIGLHVYTSVSGLADAECIGESSIHDNIASGWDQAGQVHQGGQRNLIHHNIFANSEDGLKTWAPSLSMQDNMISDCTTALSFERGGVIGSAHFRSASATPDPFAIEVIGAPGAVSAWTWETGRRSFVVGTTELELGELGAKISGEIVVSVVHTTGHYNLEIGRLDYDGTTLVYYRERRLNGGSLILSTAAPFGIKNGNLAIAVFNGGASTVTGARVSVGFRGLHIWS